MGKSGGSGSGVGWVGGIRDRRVSGVHGGGGGFIVLGVEVGGHGQARLQVLQW